jgi:hypothetical protein
MHTQLDRKPKIGRPRLNVIIVSKVEVVNRKVVGGKYSN